MNLRGSESAPSPAKRLLSVLGGSELLAVLTLAVMTCDAYYAVPAIALRQIALSTPCHR